MDFVEGEELRTEVSAKFRRDRVAAELADAGFELTNWWTDTRGPLRRLPVPGGRSRLRRQEPETPGNDYWT